PGDREVDGAELGARTRNRDARNPDLLGRQSARPDRGLTMAHEELEAGQTLASTRGGGAAETGTPGLAPEPGDRTREDEPVSDALLHGDGRDSQEAEDFRYHTGTIQASPVESSIEFIEVHKAFGRNQVLRGLNMGLPEGKISMIIGPSGTGKSVCIKHIVGLLYPYQGDVLVQGRSVPSLPDADRFKL